MVITLIPIWTHKGGHFRTLLVNFMDLVNAIRLATSHTVSEASILSYESTFRNYLEQYAKLFPWAAITPSLHTALHLGDRLRLFGPVRHSDCFPFERKNYDAQQVPTDGVPGI